MFHGWSDNILELRVRFCAALLLLFAESSRETEKRETAIDKRSILALELHVMSSYCNVWLNVAKSATSLFREPDVFKSSLFPHLYRTSPFLTPSNNAFKIESRIAAFDIAHLHCRIISITISIYITINVTSVCNNFL